jgi:hypothetical protein
MLHYSLGTGKGQVYFSQASEAHFLECEASFVHRPVIALAHGFLTFWLQAHSAAPDPPYLVSFYFNFKTIKGCTEYDRDFHFFTYSYKTNRLDQCYTGFNFMIIRLVPTFAGRWCHVVSVTDPYGRVLGLLDRSHYVFLPSSSSIELTRLSGPRSIPTTSQKIW